MQNLYGGLHLRLGKSGVLDFQWGGTERDGIHHNWSSVGSYCKNMQKWGLQRYTFDDSGHVTNVGNPPTRGESPLAVADQFWPFRPSLFSHVLPPFWCNSSINIPNCKFTPTLGSSKTSQQWVQFNITSSSQNQATKTSGKKNTSHAEVWKEKTIPRLQERLLNHKYP